MDNLWFMPSGRLPIDAVGILNSQRMIDLIQQLKASYDMVFFDSPPVLGVSDASVIASSVDLTLVVVQHRRFPKAMLLRVKQTLQNVGAKIVGCVLNNTDIRHDEYYGYYTSYYQYYSPQQSKNTPQKTPEKDASSKKEADGKY